MSMRVGTVENSFCTIFLSCWLGSYQSSEYVEGYVAPTLPKLPL